MAKEVDCFVDTFDDLYEAEPLLMCMIARKLGIQNDSKLFRGIFDTKYPQIKDHFSVI